MLNRLGYSLYLSTFAAQWETLRGFGGSGTPVFLSLHISEEFDDTYCRRAEEICHTLADSGLRIIADVSGKTQKQFGCRSLPELARRLGIWALRIDYGFTVPEILEMARQIPVVLNASTTSVQDARAIVQGGGEVYAMHNFYPRPETGLDEDLLLDTTRALQQAGVRVLAFIPGDRLLRGPVYQGLPTLEAHRGMPPSAAFADMVLRFGMDGVFLADPGISECEAQRIDTFCREGILSVPAVLDSPWESLYDRVFTCRIDSPRWLVRFQESREYSCFGASVAPENCVPRLRGYITLDNSAYGRYSGEVQLIRRDLPQDDRVNVIGRVPERWLCLTDCIRGGQKFRLVRDTENA